MLFFLYLIEVIIIYMTPKGNQVKGKPVFLTMLNALLGDSPVNISGFKNISDVNYILMIKPKCKIFIFRSNTRILIKKILI